MKILITAGPTNEKIDEVMKITNMSTGRLGIALAEQFDKQGCYVKLLLTKGIPYDGFCDTVRFESTTELMSAIEEASKEHFDVVIHAAAVADYKADYSFKLEDMATEIAKNLFDDCHYIEEYTLKEIRESILNTLTNPSCKINNDTKISSMEPNLTIKLGLTPKIIRSLRGLFPNAKIFGFKLLENVSKEELYAAALGIIKKSDVDAVFANDLKDLRHGDRTRHVVTKNGFTGIDLEDYSDIVNYVVSYKET